MELRWKVVRREDEPDDGIEAVLVLEGSVHAASSGQLAEELCRAAEAFAEERPTLDFSRVSGDVDALLASVLAAIREGRAPGVSLSGLTQHQLRVLEYLGLFHAREEQGEA